MSAKTEAKAREDARAEALARARRQCGSSEAIESTH